MFNFFLKGGLLMWPILACSVIATTIILERTYHFWQIKTKIPNLLARVKNLIKDSKPGPALQLCENTPGPLAHILAITLHVRNRTTEEKEKLLSRAGTRLVRQSDKNLRGLAIIGNITPLLGLLGTVTGMIKAFIKIQTLGGGVDASVLAGGIWEALITTAFGLAVAIPTLVAYHYFEGKVDNTAALMKDAVCEILEA